MSKPSTRSGKAGPWNASKLTRFANIYNNVLQVLQNMQGNVMSEPHKQILKTALAPQVPWIGPKVMSNLWVADTFGTAFGFVFVGTLQTHTVRLLAQIASFLTRILKPMLWVLRVNIMSTTRHLVPPLHRAHQAQILTTAGIRSSCFWTPHKP